MPGSRSSAAARQRKLLFTFSGADSLDPIMLLTLMAAIAAKPPSPARPPEAAPKEAALFHALEGRWDCNGNFANGKPIGSRLQIAPDLGGFGLRLVHSDRPPNTYFAEESWSKDAVSGKLVSLAWIGVQGSPQRSPALYVADEVSASNVTFVQQSLLAPPWTPNRFRYVVEGRSFRIFWETEKNGQWLLGDSLRCLPARGAAEGRGRN